MTRAWEAASLAVRALTFWQVNDFALTFVVVSLVLIGPDISLYGSSCIV